MGQLQKAVIAILIVTFLVLRAIDGRPSDSIEDPPVDPGILKYLSENLLPEECLKVYGFLVVRNSVAQLHKLVNWTETTGYVDYLRIAHDKLNTQQKAPFACLNSLAFWNVRLVGEFTKDMIDREDFAETLLRVSLNFAKRYDLGKFVHSFTTKRHSENLQGLIKEMESHSSQMVFYGMSNKLTIKKSNKMSTPMVLLSSFGILSLIFLVILCIVIAKRSAQRTQLPPTSTRIKKPNTLYKILDSSEEDDEDLVGVSSPNTTGKMIVNKTDGKLLLGSINV